MVLGIKMVDNSEILARVEVIGTYLFFVTDNSREFMCDLHMSREEIEYLYEQLSILFDQDNSIFESGELSLKEFNGIYYLKIKGLERTIEIKSNSLIFYKR